MADSLSPAQRRLAAALRALRMRSGMSAAALARKLGPGWTQTRVSRTELGQRRISGVDANQWAEAVEAPAESRDELTDLLNEADREVRTWWDFQAAGGVARRQADVASYEARSTRVSNFQPVVPGLLQTADYARRVFTLANVDGQSDVGASVVARMRRQEILYDPSRQFDYVLPESALRWVLTGDSTVQRAQADRLISVDSLPNVTLAVLPFTAAPPVLPAGGFVIYEMPGEPLALIETLISDLIFTGEREVAVYRSAFAGLQAAAVTGEAAHALIREAMITDR
jgi:transcriptional regulator with XRE-family HTH domain